MLIRVNTVGKPKSGAPEIALTSFVLSIESLRCVLGQDSHSASLHPSVEMGTGELNAGGNPAMDSRPIQGRVVILPVASCYENRDKLRPDEPLGSYEDFTFTF